MQPPLHFLFPSPTFSFFFSLSLWSQPGSGPRISPQRHNYFTGLNVPPTSYSSHQRPSLLQTLAPSEAFGLSLSIISMFLLPDASNNVWKELFLLEDAVKVMKWELTRCQRNNILHEHQVPNQRLLLFFFMYTWWLTNWQSAVVVRTNSECVRGVDLAVGRRIKWLIGGPRRGEGVKRSDLPPSLFFFSPSARRKGHWGWTNKSHGHQTQLTTAALGLHSDSVLLVSAACTSKPTLCLVSPSTSQWFYKSP